MRQHPEYDPVGRNAPVLPELVNKPKPIAGELTPEDIAVMYSVKRYGPNEFNQNLLERFRAAGAPVEGFIILRLAHGKIYKLKTETTGVGKFIYMWLPEAYVAGINALGGVA